MIKKNKIVKLHKMNDKVRRTKCSRCSHTLGLITKNYFKGFIECYKCDGKWCYDCINTQNDNFRFPCSCKKKLLKDFVLFKDIMVKDFMGSIVEIKGYNNSRSYFEFKNKREIIYAYVYETVSDYTINAKNNVGPGISILLKREGIDSSNQLLERNGDYGSMGGLWVRHAPKEIVMKIKSLREKGEVRFDYETVKSFDYEKKITDFIKKLTKF